VAAEESVSAGVVASGWSGLFSSVMVSYFLACFAAATAVAPGRLDHPGARTAVQKARGPVRGII
jgi:hypothetical protein